MMMGMNKYISRVSGPFERIFYRYIHNELYTLNKAIRNMNLLEDGTLFLEFGDLKFYGMQDNGSVKFIYETPDYKHGNPQKMRRIIEIRGLGNFGDFLGILRDDFVRNEYEIKSKEGYTVVDVGASFGSFAIREAKRVGDKGKVIAIEPEENNLKLLEKNKEANELENITIVPKAAWDKKGKERLYTTEVPGWHSLKEVDEFTHYGGPLGEVEVETDTIDNILEELGIRKVDCMKIDAEGAESEVIKGAYNTLMDNDVKLAVETHMIGGEINDRDIVSQLEEVGYKTRKTRKMILAKK